MLVKNLEGALLDLWVARAQGNEARININETEVLLTEGHRGIGPQWYIFEPSTNWRTGGPIIEREGIATLRYSGDWWEARHPFPHSHTASKSLLVAAMRAYVASKYGDEVPDTTA